MSPCPAERCFGDWARHFHLPWVHTIAIFLFLLLLDAPAPSSATVRTHTFATLTERQARPLISKRARYRVELDSPETDLDGFHCFEADRQTLAKRIDSKVRDVTQSGAIMGTGSYMAPEQAAGKVRDTGPAADVYALGVLLYECLTGQPPFTGPQHVVLVSVLNEEPLPPRRRSPAVPRDLETICLKCLHKTLCDVMEVRSR